MTIDETVRKVLYDYRTRHGDKDPKRMQVTKTVYRDLVKEYTPYKTTASPAQWNTTHLRTLYGVQIIVTDKVTMYDKNGCYRSSIHL